jgi:hypothetical protein
MAPKSIGFSSVAMRSARVSSFALCSSTVIYFWSNWIFKSACLDYAMISFSEMSMFDRSSNVKPESKVVRLYDPLPSLLVPKVLSPLGVPPLFGVCGLLLLDTLDTLDLFICPERDLIVYNSFSKFI